MYTDDLSYRTQLDDSPNSNKDNNGILAKQSSRVIIDREGQAPQLILFSGKKSTQDLDQQV